jgi:MFS family permease
VSGRARTAVGRDPGDPRAAGNQPDRVSPREADAAPGAGKATFAEVFGVTEFRALWLAQLLSVAGDQLARVAMTILVYDRTHSALLTAATYAVSFLPWVIGGLALSGLADRLPRREVMVACDVMRMVLVCLMALVSLDDASALALWGMVILLFIVTLLDSPFKSARSAMLPDVLPGERYVLGVAVSQMTIQIGNAAGFAAGGIVVATMGVRVALLADAATFAASALLAWFWVRHRPAAASPAGGRRSQAGEMAAGVRLVFGDRTLRTLVLFGWLVAFYFVPTGLAAPYAAGLRSSLPIAVSAGLIFAAEPFGAAVGAVVFGRMVPQKPRQRWMGLMAVGTCGLLLLCLLHLGLVGAIAVIAASGLCASYQLAANAAFVKAVPAARRGQAFGLANGGMQILQGLFIVLAGAIATSHALTPAEVIAASGGAGAVVAAALAMTAIRNPTITGADR